MNPFKKTKAQLKILAADLRAAKQEFRRCQSAGEPTPCVPQMSELYFNTRGLHLAYGLLRGRTMEQMESKYRNPDDYWHRMAFKKRDEHLARLKEEVAAYEASLCNHP